jgi:phosphoribosylamine---glycine ligase
MKVLLVGSGGREHALAAALRSGGSATEIFVAPGNAGMAKIADIVPISADSVIELADFAERAGVQLTVVGPELPLTLGIVDEFQKRELPIFGPTRLATEIEASKVFSKELCRRLGIPTAQAWLCSSRGDAERALAELGFPAVIKADGLAAGKGVMVVATPDEAKVALDLFFQEKVFGTAGDRVLVEEFLEGEEASFLALCDGKTALALPTAKDYKKVFEGDRGPNTGGMGAHSPAGVLGGEQAAAVVRDIVHPVLSSMAQDRRAFCGLLYVGLMLTPDGMKVLEFNARFGDPETEAILPRLASDITPVLSACTEGNLAGCELAWKPEACVAVVLASAGYPGSYQTGFPIEGLEEAESLPGATVFHAGTALRDGAVVTSGGRVLVVCGRGANLSEASDRAYAAADRIRFEGKSYRRDIGARFLGR